MTTDRPAKIEGIPAATIVVMRKGADGAPPQILMVTRARSMAFASGAAVFPGGRVDPEDRALARQFGAADEDEAAHRIAAIRETLEETGLAIGLREEVSAHAAREARSLLIETGALGPVLERMGWTLDLDRIVPFARWFPKNEKLSRVFDTRFYLYDIGTGAVDIAVDETENTRLFWIGAREALDAAERGEIELIFPTKRNLERLAQFRNFDEARRDCAAHPVHTIIPFLQMREGRPWICIPADAGYPVDGEPLETMRRG